MEMSHFMKVLDRETADKNRKHSDRQRHIHENQHEFVKSLSNKSGLEYDLIVMKLPMILEELTKKESSFIRDIIFYQVPLISAGQKIHMNLNQSEEFYQTCYDKILHILNTMEVK